MKKNLPAVIISLLLLIFAQAAGAYVASSPNYQLEKDSLNFGGADVSSSANYVNIDTLGEIISGLSGGTNYNASSGYRMMELDTPAIYGCTDPDANNYDPSATIDDGSCDYDQPPGTTTVFGCTDPLATNYNSNATADDGSCNYLVPNVSNFQAQYNDARQAIHLTWQNPDYDFAAIIIVRQANSIPSGPQDGEVVYNGLGEETWDYDVEEGIRYYYAAFVRSQDNRYSSGVVASERVPSSEQPPEVPPEEPSGEEISPFEYLSAGTSTAIEWDIKFLQPQEREKTFDWLKRVYVRGEKNLTVVLNPDRTPQTLKTIGATLTDPLDSSKTFSFLLHLNNEGTAYEATIAPLIRLGTYPIDIYIVNYSNLITEHFKGYLIVSGQSAMLSSETIDKLITPIATAGLTVSLMPSFYDLLLALYRIFSSFFGRKRNEKPWGTVYDSVTKRPLDPVYLQVFQEQKEVANAITDIDGRFSFFLPAGTYYLRASKTHYKFPSEKMRGKTADELYNNLYFGESFVTTGQEVFNLDIPMDPIDFDWNEFAKTKTNFFRFYARREIWLNRLFKLIFATGFAFSIYALIVRPSVWNIAIIILYLGLFALNVFWPGRGKPLQVVKVIRELEKKDYHEPLPFAIVRVFLADLNQQVRYTVADQFGNFYFLVRPGVYYYTVEEKQNDGSYLKIYQSNPTSLPKGILKGNIYVK